ncbi:DUF4351 domain-containing protein, partial [Candidatus Magnetaquicoccus inordinatus]|uniref:DUF4351 domain-containing protein n=1 Tax=Candidatus Magnetaquicoccus inordinatus TaxID=2496818 RepID=UPI00102C956A
EQCEGILEKWLYFIRYAETFDRVPEQLDLPPFRHAFEKAMLANMTEDELDLYDKAGIAIADTRGRLKLAREEGKQEGRAEGRAEGIGEGERMGMANVLLRLLQQRFGQVPDEIKAKVTAAARPRLERWTGGILEAKGLEDLFAD